MTIVIKLDASAVRELIKNDSEVHLELSQAVIQEIIKRMRLPTDFDLTKLLKAELNSLVKEVPAAYIHEGYTPSLSSKAKELIRSQVFDSYNSILRAKVLDEIDLIINQQKEIITASLAARIEQRLDTLTPEIDKMSRILVLEHLSKIVNIAGSAVGVTNV